MMKKERQGYVPKRGDDHDEELETESIRASKRNRSDVATSSNQPARSEKARRFDSEQDIESDGNDEEDSDSDEDSDYGDPKFDSIAEIYQSCLWNSTSSRRQLRLLMLRDGAKAGDIVELLAPAAARKRGERWFMEVLDGTILDKSSDEPMISSCRWWENWMPGQFTGPDASVKDSQPQEVRCIIDWGSAKDMMKKERQGYVPKRGASSSLCGESNSAKAADSPIKCAPIHFVFRSLSSFVASWNFLFVLLADFLFRRIRERILLQGTVEPGHVLEVLPPSGDSACHPVSAVTDSAFRRPEQGRALVHAGG
jgi:hypothetical protein